MIVDRTAGTIQLLRESLRPLLLLFAWDVFVVLAFQLAHRSWMDQPALPYSLIGSVLVLFMSVRNNAAYARWWEARTLWGGILNNCRCFARQAETLARGRPDLTRAMIGYAHALRGMLRGADVSADIAPFLSPEMFGHIVGRRNQANGILYEVGREIAKSARQHNIDGSEHAAIEATLSDLADAQGGLERIMRTPLAIQFSLLPGLITRVFCTVLPLSMVQHLGWITPLGSTLVGFLFVALDRVGSDLESPFADTGHALPLQAITRGIEIDLLQTIGEPAPAPILPSQGVLR